jgi:hypothetical protein
MVFSLRVFAKTTQRINGTPIAKVLAGLARARIQRNEPPIKRAGNDAVMAHRAVRDLRTGPGRDPATGSSTILFGHFRVEHPTFRAAVRIQGENSVVGRAIKEGVIEQHGRNLQGSLKRLTFDDPINGIAPGMEIT